MAADVHVDGGPTRDARDRLRAVRPRRRHGRRRVRDRSREPRRRATRCLDHARRHARLSPAARAHAAAVRGRAPRHAAPDGVVVLEGAALPGLVALAIGADGDARVETNEGEARAFAIRRELRIAAGQHADVAFYIAAGPEQDGAAATASVMRRRGWRELLAGHARRAARARADHRKRGARPAHQSQPAVRVLLRRRARARRRALLPRAHARAVAWARRHGARLGGAHVDAARGAARRRPARARAPAARVRAARLRAGQRRALPRRHAVRAGLLPRGCGGVRARDRPLHPRHRRRSDRRGARARRHALPRRPRTSRARRDERRPAVLHRSDAARARRRRCRSRCTATRSSRRRSMSSGARSTRRPRATCRIPKPCARRCKRHFARERDGKSMFASAIDLAGNAVPDDDPLASVLWLPLYEAVDRNDSTYRRTVRAASARPRFLVQQCARLLGPGRADGAAVAAARAARRWLRRRASRRRRARDGERRRCVARGLAGVHALVRRPRARRDAMKLRDARHAVVRAPRLSVSRCAEYTQSHAGIAQLVEHNLAKVGVAGSSPVSRSRKNHNAGAHDGSGGCRSRFVRTGNAVV